MDIELLLVFCVVVFFFAQVIQAGMFNQNSTSSERRAFLMAILDTENDEDEVMNPFCMFMLYRKNSGPN